MIAYINPRDKLHDRALYIIDRCCRDKLIISQIVVLELYSIFSRVMSISDVGLEALVNYTIKRCGVNIAYVDWDKLYGQALSYANKPKLKTLDLLHTIAAYILGAKVMFSFDKDINRRSIVIKDLLGLDVIGLEK